MSEKQEKIVVVGVGCCGKNVVNQMIDYGVQGVEFLVIDTDDSTLLTSKVQKRMQIGSKLPDELGRGGRRGIVNRAMKASKELILEQLEGAGLVFIVAGMGGSTGSNAAPHISLYATEAGAVTVGLATMPFTFEGMKRIDEAVYGIVNLRHGIDTIIEIENESTLKYIKEDASGAETCRIVNDTFCKAVKGIVDIIKAPGLINASIEDVRGFLSRAGSAWIGFGSGTGDDGAAMAAQKAVRDMVREIPLTDARKVLFTVAGGKDFSMYDFTIASNIIADAVDSETDILFGAIVDESLTDEIQVTVIAAKGKGK